MTPTAYSLLALAALLASSNAQSNCKTVLLFGEVTAYPIVFRPTSFYPGGSRISVQDECANRGQGSAVAETITVCNNDQGGVAPDARLANPPYVSPIDVICTDGCPSGGTAVVTQYCAY